MYHRMQTLSDMLGIREEYGVAVRFSADKQRPTTNLASAKGDRRRVRQTNSGKTETQLLRNKTAPNLYRPCTGIHSNTRSNQSNTVAAMWQPNSNANINVTDSGSRELIISPSS